MYQIIQSLRETQGSKAKQAILDANANNTLFRNFMQAVYDPALSYYIRKLPKATPTGMDSPFDEALIDWTIAELAGRKITGSFALKCVQATLSNLDAEGRELYTLLLKRSIGGSVGETMVLKTWPGLFFVPPYMRCAGMSAKVREEYEALPYFYVQTKYDGSFAYLKSTSQGNSLFTRAGSFYPEWLPEAIALYVPEGLVLMGELLVFEGGKPLSRKVSNGMLNSLLQGGDDTGADIRLIAWDMVLVEEFEAGKSVTPYWGRFAGLRASTGGKIELAASTKVESLEHAFELNREAMARGEEGTVWKKPDGSWKDSSSGTRDAVKVKVIFEAEFKVVGKYEGQGKAKGMLGGFNIESSCGLIANNVGSGFSDKQRIDFWAEDTDGWIITLEANDVVSEDGSSTESLFLPIFIERRLDKTEADSRERVMEQLRQAREGS